MANSIAYAGYIIALVGAIVIIIFGILELLGSAFLVFSPLAFLGGIAFGIVQIIVGIICMIGAKFVSNYVWAIVLIVLGILAGNIGGSLVILGAILGIVSRLVKTASAS